MHPSADGSSPTLNDEASIDTRGKSLGALIISTAMEKCPQAENWVAKNEKVWPALTES
jgi:hypothetical protein